PHEVGAGGIVEILLIAQDPRPLVVEVEERRKVVELVGQPQRVDRDVLQPRPVLGRGPDCQLGLERALDMERDVRLGHAADDGAEIGGRDPFGSVPSTPSAYQLTLSISLSVRVGPAGALTAPPWSLIGPWNTWHLPATSSAFVSATCFLTLSGSAA